MTAALRAAVIAEWRGLPQRKARPDRFHTPGELPLKIMQRLGLSDRLHDTKVIVAGSTIVLLTGCTATVVRWNSVKMREEIIAYYNDEIMDNLIKMSEGLPFVHVDISSVSAAGVSQVSGTVGAGETESFTKTSPSSSMMGALHTITRAATAPF